MGLGREWRLSVLVVVAVCGYWAALQHWTRQRLQHRRPIITGRAYNDFEVHNTHHVEDDSKHVWTFESGIAKGDGRHTDDDDEDSIDKIESIKIYNVTLPDMPDNIRIRPSVRMFKSESNVTSRPAIILVHGAGTGFGTLEFYEPVCKWLAAHTGMIIFAIGSTSTKKPAHPVAVHAAANATSYLLRNATAYSVDPTRVAIVGDNTGALIAAAVTLKLRDTGFEPPLKAQVLIYPLLQALEFRLPSYQHHRDEGMCLDGVAHFWCVYGLRLPTKGEPMTSMAKIFKENNHTSAEIKQRYAKYLNPNDLPTEYKPANYQMPRLDYGNQTLWKELESVFLDPYFAPGIAENLGNLPAAMVMTVGKDPLRDEAVLYAQRMKRDGTETVHKHYPGCFPGVLTQPHFRETPQFRRDIANFLIHIL